MDFLAKHSHELSKKYPGKHMVAVTNTGIVASGDSLSEVSAFLKEKGIKLDEVMVMKVPRKDEEILLSA